MMATRIETVNMESSSSGPGVHPNTIEFSNILTNHMKKKMRNLMEWKYNMFSKLKC